MKSLFKKIFTALFPLKALQYRAYKKMISDHNSYLYSTGWIQSLEAGRPVNKDGNPIPWMNFPVIKLLEEKLTRDMKLFEYGSGYSTFFFAGKVKVVFSVEYDEKWFRLIQSQVPGNVNLIYKKKDIDGEYCRVISSMEDQFDVVVVDGRDRVNCIKHCIPALSARGVILLDDSQRERYQEAIGFAIARGFKALNIEGLKATGVGIDRTTIFYREGNCLGI